MIKQPRSCQKNSICPDNLVPKQGTWLLSHKINLARQHGSSQTIFSSHSICFRRKRLVFANQTILSGKTNWFNKHNVLQPQNLIPASKSGSIQTICLQCYPPRQPGSCLKPPNLIPARKSGFILAIRFQP